jgi:hypothetical protein
LKICLYNGDQFPNPHKREKTVIKFSPNKLPLTSAIALITLSTFTPHTFADVTVLDKTHFPAANFLAYTEFELSGEPLAEALGLDLDLLDPDVRNEPTEFDFNAGIESYEYSEEAMYALNYQSQMGPHLANGPINAERGGKLSTWGLRTYALAAAVGFPVKKMPKNLYPISVPYMSGNPELAQAAAITTSIIDVNGDELEITTYKGSKADGQTVLPAFAVDYSSLAWDDASFDKTLNPAAIGGILLKEVMWSQDFLGGMHTHENDEEVEAESATMDADGEYRLGVSAVDGFNGMLLTEISIDKLNILQSQLGYNGTDLGSEFTPSYDPKNGAIWFAHKVAVTEGEKNGVTSIESLKVSDSSSQLRDTWQLLWPVAEYFAYSDQRVANTAQNPAFLAVFDGKPFAQAPANNTDADANNDVVASDAFSAASNISNLLSKNIAALHFNEDQGTFVTEYKNGKQGLSINTYDAAYSMVALGIHQRAQDALPVGYASGDSSDLDLKSASGKKALSMMAAQADFIIEELINAKGLVVDGAEIKESILGDSIKASASVSLDGQFSAIRGLVAAFLATDDVKYKNAARSIYLAVEKHMFDKNLGTWATTPGEATIHTPYTAAAISGGLRETMLHLANAEGENEPALELSLLTQRYTAWFSTVINGGAQLAEWLGDSGEHIERGNDSTDTDNDGVHQIIGAGGKFGTAMTMANEVSVK